MTPAATLIYVQNFSAWITAEALKGRPGTVDKYCGDEVMDVYPKEFASAYPLVDAVTAAAAIDALIQRCGSVVPSSYGRGDRR